jgi:hypothetical protein
MTNVLLDALRPACHSLRHPCSGGGGGVLQAHRRKRTRAAQTASLNKMQRHGRRIKRRLRCAYMCERDRWIPRASRPLTHSQTHTHVCAAGKKRRWTRRALCGKWILAINLGGCKPAVQLVRSADDGGHRSADRDTRVAIYYPAAVGPWLILNWDCGTRTRATANKLQACVIYTSSGRLTWTGSSSHALYLFQLHFQPPIEICSKRLIESQVPTYNF